MLVLAAMLSCPGGVGVMFRHPESNQMLQLGSSLFKRTKLQLLRQKVWGADFLDTRPVRRHSSRDPLAGLLPRSSLCDVELQGRQER